MKPFRFLLIGLGVAVTAAAPALAQSCLQPTEQAAFHVRALQSQLMVAALACDRHDDYNGFVRRHMNDLNGAQRQVHSHFRRVHGRAHQRQLDDYITALANSQSQDGIRQGSHFCMNMLPLFRQAMSVSSSAHLAELARDRNVVNPIGAPSCSGASQAATAEASAPPARRASTSTRAAAPRQASATRTASASRSR